MPFFESPKWKISLVWLEAANVASVAFNQAAHTTEITMKKGKTFVVTDEDGTFGFETDKPDVIPVKGTVEEVKRKLGFQ